MSTSTIGRSLYTSARKPCLNIASGSNDGRSSFLGLIDGVSPVAFGGSFSLRACVAAFFARFWSRFLSSFFETISPVASSNCS